MRGIAGGLVFEDGEGRAHELVEKGHDDSHFAEAAFGQAVRKDLEARVMSPSADGREVKSLAQVAVAGGTNPGRFRSVPLSESRGATPAQAAAARELSRMRGNSATSHWARLAPMPGIASSRAQSAMGR